MIDFTRAFGTAWERMHVILFRPFDFGKWGVIGFGAFLALLAEGGVSFNNPIPFQQQNRNYQFDSQSIPHLLHSFKEFTVWAQSLLGNSMLALYLGLGVAYLVLWLVGNWIGCRGQFIFLDNIVRNRAGVAQPWQRYARQGNIWFLVHIALMAVSSFIFIVLGGAFILSNWTWINAERAPSGGEVGALVASLLVLFAVYVLFVVVMFLIRSFVVPVYFKQAVSLGGAFSAVGRLLITHPGSIICYVLVSFALAIAAGVISVLIFFVFCCVIIWLVCVPCIGSMLLSLLVCQIILPVLIFLRCFQLDCLAQFGPEYNVWTVDVPTDPGYGGTLPFNLQPPPG